MRAYIKLTALLIATSQFFFFPPTVAAADVSRIVCAGGAITEILYELGAADKIIAVDSTSLFPPEALKSKTNVGYFRALSTEGVLSVNPSLIIASDKAGPPEVVKALKSAGIPYAEIEDLPAPEALVRRVRMVAKLIGQEAKGETLVARIDAEFAQLAKDRASITKPLRVLFILSVQNGRAIAGGRNSAADSMLRLAGAVNAADGFEGYKPVTDEALISMNPDAIVLTKTANLNSREAIAGLKGVADSPAGRKQRYIEMDGLLFLGFGPRAPSAARQLMLTLNAMRAEEARGSTQ